MSTWFCNKKYYLIVICVGFFPVLAIACFMEGEQLPSKVNLLISTFLNASLHSVISPLIIIVPSKAVQSLNVLHRLVT